MVQCCGKHFGVYSCAYRVLCEGNAPLALRLFFVVFNFESALVNVLTFAGYVV